MRNCICWIGTLGVVLFAATSAVQARGFGARGVAVGGARGGAVVGSHGGVGFGGARGGAVYTPRGATVGGARGGTYVGPRGTTIHGGSVGGVHVGPRGVTTGGARGVGITTPGGQTIRTGSIGGVHVGPGGVAVGGARGVGVTGPRFPTDVGAYARYGAIRRPGAPVYSTRYVSGTALRNQGVYVRRSFYGRPYFNAGWYNLHVGSWYPRRWTYATVWTVPLWTTLAPYCGYPVAYPIYYDYGTTIVYQGDQVYDNGTPIATASAYAQQASNIAATGLGVKPAENAEWQPLGVFGVVQGDETTSNNIFQLAVNKDGIIRGNYYNAITDTTEQVYGSVDKKTQRAAWTVGDRKEPVFETGIYNLTKNETPLLVHFGKNGTQQWTLVRLEQPPDGK